MLGLLVSMALVACSTGGSGTSSPESSGANADDTAVDRPGAQGETTAGATTLAIPAPPAVDATMTAGEVSAALADEDEDVRMRAAVSAFAKAGVPLFDPEGGARGAVGVPWMYVFVHANPPSQNMMFLDLVTRAWSGFAEVDRAEVEAVMLRELQQQTSGDFVAELVAADQLRYTGVPVADLSSVADVHVHPLTALLAASAIYYSVLAAVATDEGGQTPAAPEPGAGPPRTARPRALKSDCMTGELGGWVQYALSKILGGIPKIDKVLPGVTAVIVKGLADLKGGVKAVRDARIARVDKVLGFFGTALSLLTFLWQYFSSNGSVTAPELERTRETGAPGAVVTATVTAQFGNKDKSRSGESVVKALNCVQMLMSAVGVNSSLAYGEAGGVRAKLVGLTGFGSGQSGWVQFPGPSDTYSFELDDNGSASVEIEGKPQERKVAAVTPQRKRPYKVDLQIAFDKSDTSTWVKTGIDGLVCGLASVTFVGCVDFVLDLAKQIRYSVGTFELPAIDYHQGWRHFYPSAATNNALKVSGVVCSLAESWSATEVAKGYENVNTTFIFTPNPDGASGKVEIMYVAPGISWKGTSSYTAAEQSASFGPEGTMVIKIAATTLRTTEPGAGDIAQPSVPIYLKPDPGGCSQ